MTPLSSPESPGAAPPRRKRIVIVDDSESYCELWARFLLDRYGFDRVQVEIYLHPLQAMPHIDPSVDLLLLDLEMPMIDGRKFLEYAVFRGVDRRRIIVASGRHADLLHDIFPTGECLAVINKTEPKQQEAFLMILDGVMRRS